jgi:SAM-dependent methyltransferase
MNDTSSAGNDSVAGPLLEQLEYYRARAGEYDEWWLRRGRYDRGKDLNARWFRDIDELNNALAAFGPAGRVLELAGGTGIWSERLLEYADRLTVVDGSREMLAINEARLGSSRATFVNADLFSWRPQERFDVVFFSFWLSHVPDSEFEGFWSFVRSCLAPDGRVFFIDSLRMPASTSTDQPLADGTMTERRLNDGRTFRIFKIYYDCTALERRLSRLRWRAAVNETSEYFLYGAAAPIET